jgi:hypothetical protein
MRTEADDSSEDAAGDGWLAPIAHETLTQYVLYIQDASDAEPIVEFNVDPPLLYNCAYGCITTEIGSSTLGDHTLQPNPASDHIELISAGPGPLHWEIRDGKGMLCDQGTDGPALSIPVAHLAPGLYLLRTVAADGSVRAYRWVKE